MKAPAWGWLDHLPAKQTVARDLAAMTCNAWPVPPFCRQFGSLQPAPPRPRRFSKFDRFTVADLELADASFKDFEAAAAPPPDLPARRPGPPVDITVLPLGPGLWMLGPAYHSLLVEFSHHTELVEGATLTKAMAYFETARRLVPNKPLTKVIITHHDRDHAGGLRAAVAQGLTIVTYKTNKQYFEEIASRPHALQPDAQQLSPKLVKFELIDEEKTFKDPMRTLQLIHMAGSEHSDNLVMAYLPDDKLLVGADFWDIRFPRQPFLANMLEIMRKYNVKADHQVDIHAGLIPGPCSTGWWRKPRAELSRSQVSRLTVEALCGVRPQPLRRKGSHLATFRDRQE
jgi:glyoxylase-like metal-dependent hydrolase (beta-lactamase superfamily II)